MSIIYQRKFLNRLVVILILFSFHFTAHSLLIAKVEKLDNKSFNSRYNLKYF